MESYGSFENIGNGAFGVVLKALDGRTGEKVAVKTVRAGGDALLREAALMLAACSGNPYVVGFREVARSSETDQLHHVMEFVGPGTLHDVLAARRRGGRPFSETEARGAMRKLLGGAEAMHARGVVHCDLMPGNVLASKRDGRLTLKICNFGLAQSIAVRQCRRRRTRRSPRARSGTWRRSSSWGRSKAARPATCGRWGASWRSSSPGSRCSKRATSSSWWSRSSTCWECPTTCPESGLPLLVSPPSQLRDVVPEQVMSQAGFHLLRGLLEFDPNDRLNAAAALRMPWFTA